MPGQDRIRLGRANEGLQICAEVLELRPFDADLIANYGLALLISKRIDEAEEAVAASLSLSLQMTLLRSD